MKRIKNLLLYGGLEREQYISIRERIRESNRVSLITYALITAIGMLALWLLSFFLEVLASSRFAYVMAITASLLMLLVAIGPAKQYTICTPVCVSVFTSLLLAFGIILGTVVEPNQASASFGILIFAVPLLFADTPLITDCQIFLAILIYCVAARTTQSDEMLSFNLSFVLPYGIVSMILCAIIMRMKISNQMLIYENKQLSEKDQLTGMLNRRSYEIKLEQLRNAKHFERVLFCAFDLNGLKHANDTLGHHAGDELICGAAECIQQVFGAYGTCFRTGGDEFFAIIEGASTQEEELVAELERSCNAFQGRLVSRPSISVGMQWCEDREHVTRDVQEADRRMYKNKEAFHSKTIKA